MHGEIIFGVSEHMYIYVSNSVVVCVCVCICRGPLGTVYRPSGEKNTDLLVFSDDVCGTAAEAQHKALLGHLRDLWLGIRSTAVNTKQLYFCYASNYALV